MTQIILNFMSASPFMQISKITALFLLNLIYAVDADAQQWASPLFLEEKLDLMSGKHTLTLKEVVFIARQNSIEAKLAEVSRKIVDVNFLMFNAESKPELQFNADLPGYNKSNLEVRQPDGSIKFLPRIQTFGSAGFSITQPLRFTGGSISLNSSITRYSDISLKDEKFNTTPVFLKITQPLLVYNPFRSNKKIATLKSEEAGNIFQNQMLLIASEAARLYFDLLQAQVNTAISQRNFENAKLNYERELIKQKLGASTDERILQLQLLLNNSRRDLQHTAFNEKISQASMKLFLMTADTLKYVLSLPVDVPRMDFDITHLLGHAKLSNQQVSAFNREYLELDTQEALNKSSNYQISINAVFGINNVANRLGRLYDQLKSQQRFSVGVGIKLADWGRTRLKGMVIREQMARNKLAKEKFESELEYDIRKQVDQLDLLKKDIEHAEENVAIAAKLFKVKEKLFQSGQISVTELHLSSLARDNEERNYISALRSHWEAWLNLQRLTGLDLFH